MRKRLVGLGHLDTLLPLINHQPSIQLKGNVMAGVVSTVVSVWMLTHVSVVDNKIDSYTAIRNFGDSHVQCWLAEEKLEKERRIKDLKYGGNKYSVTTGYYKCYDDNAVPLKYTNIPDSPKERGYAGDYETSTPNYFSGSGTVNGQSVYYFGQFNNH